MRVKLFARVSKPCSGEYEGNNFALKSFEVNGEIEFIPGTPAGSMEVTRMNIVAFKGPNTKAFYGKIDALERGADLVLDLEITWDWVKKSNAFGFQWTLMGLEVEQVQAATV